jgi:hypothetical protein
MDDKQRAECWAASQEILQIGHQLVALLVAQRIYIEPEHREIFAATLKDLLTAHRVATVRLAGLEGHSTELVDLQWRNEHAAFAWVDTTIELTAAELAKLDRLQATLEAENDALRQRIAAGFAAIQTLKQGGA